MDIFENLNFGHLKAFAKISFKKQRNVNILVRCTKSACLRSVTFCNKTSQHFSKLLYKGRYLRKKGFMILWLCPRIWKSRSQIVSSSSYKKLFFFSGFPIQFGREIICSEDLLNCESRIDWRSCQLSKEEESTCSQKFRQRFQPYDFTLEDDD